VPSKQWPVGPPVPLPQSPIHVTGPFQCIDHNTRLPVLIVEDLTFNVGDRRVAELMNEARLANNY
jgi:hypothetical protein